MSFTQEQQARIKRLRFEDKKSLRAIAKEVLGSETKESSIRKFLKKEENVGVENSFDVFDAIAHQKKLDFARVARKALREDIRVVSMLEELNKSLVEVFSSNSLSVETKKHENKENSAVGILQLSDLHFGERITEVNGNVFDTSVVCARLKKFVMRAKSYFATSGVKTVLVAMTGDLVNSDRRLDEISTNAMNRASIVFTAVDVLQQLILDLNEDFNVIVSSVCGNESRIGKDVAWGDFIASDSFDGIIHNILSLLFKDKEGVKVLPMVDPLESVVNVNGSNVLLVHGHNGTSNTSRIETEVSKIKSKYSSNDVRIDYVICGHIHSAFVSDIFARSSGLPGANAYSDKGLNLTSRASQNIFIVHGPAQIDGIKIDLQEFDLGVSYVYNTDTEAYKPVGPASSTVMIQSVVI